MAKIHISLGNGGFVFSVEKLEDGDNIIPLMVINGSMLGHQMGEMKIRMTPDRLRQLAAYLYEHAEESEKYYINKEDVWGGAAKSKFSEE